MERLTLVFTLAMEDVVLPLVDHRMEVAYSRKCRKVEFDSSKVKDTNRGEDG